MSEARQGQPDSSLPEPYSAFEASPGSLLAERYRLLSKLGQGGMGTVWRAEDRALCIEVAVKLIDPSLVESPVALARFQQEAHAAAKLRSTHIVHINDYGIDATTGQPFIAMDLLEGESLQQRLDRDGKLSMVETHRILAQVAHALELAHSKGIAHRDLKPDNVFIAREGNAEVVKVLDFGIAKRLDVMNVSGGVKTREGQMLGTPNYMSPEQARARTDVDHRADIWSFGVIAFECVTGSRPFESDNLASLVLAICNEPLPNPEQYASVPVGFAKWFAQAAARDVQTRFASIGAASNELAPLVDMPLNPRTSQRSGVKTFPAAAAPDAVEANTHAALESFPRRGSRVTERKWLFVTLVLTIGAAGTAWWMHQYHSALAPPPALTAATPAATEENAASLKPHALQTVAGSATLEQPPSVTPSSPAAIDQQGTSQHLLMYPERSADLGAKGAKGSAPNKPASPRSVRTRPQVPVKKVNPLDPGI